MAKICDITVRFNYRSTYTITFSNFDTSFTNIYLFVVAENDYRPITGNTTIEGTNNNSSAAFSIGESNSSLNYTFVKTYFNMMMSIRSDQTRYSWFGLDGSGTRTSTGTVTYPVYDSAEINTTWRLPSNLNLPVRIRDTSIPQDYWLSPSLRTQTISISNNKVFDVFPNTQNVKVRLSNGQNMKSVEEADGTIHNTFPVSIPIDVSSGADNITKTLTLNGKDHIPH